MINVFTTINIYPPPLTAVQFCRTQPPKTKNGSPAALGARWLNAATRGYVLFDFKTRPDTYPGALKSPQAEDWSVVWSAGRARARALWGL